MCDVGVLIGRIVTFVNLCDRGHRAKGAAWLAGKQHALQPPSARSDERFRDRTTVYAATIAHDQSGNERAVNVFKWSGLVKRGFKPGMDPVRFDLLCRGPGVSRLILCINLSSLVFLIDCCCVSYDKFVPEVVISVTFVVYRPGL